MSVHGGRLEICMDKEKIFYILNISETKDAEKIKRAYLEALKENNPEDNPEGFKELRLAYEEAIKFANAKEERSEEDTEKNEVDLWIDSVKECYNSIYSRCDISQWEEIFDDAVCSGLDTFIEAREKLLAFLMDSINLSHDVFKLIDDTFDIIDDEETIKQQFPENFIDYLIYYIKNDTFIDYEAFEYINHDGDTKGCDKYIAAYFKCKSKVDEGNVDSIFKELDELSIYNIYHPYEDVERMRVYALNGDGDKALEIANYLYNGYDNVYITQFVANTYKQYGDKQKAYEIYDSILENESNNVIARRGKVEYLFEQGKYSDAKDMLIDILEASGENEELDKMLKDINEKVIDVYSEYIRRDECYGDISIDDMKYEIGWCYLQNEKVDKCLEYVSTIEANESYEYLNLYARVLYYHKDYREALPWLIKWKECIKCLCDDGTEKTKKRISRYTDSCYFIAGCYYEEKEFEKAIEYVNEALANTDDMRRQLDCMMFLANVYKELKQFDKASVWCDKAIDMDKGFYPGYIFRQELCMELEAYQQIIDDYHSAVEIYNGYFKPYLMATKVFAMFGMKDDAKNVIERAKENKVEFSPEFKLYELKIARQLASDVEDRKSNILELNSLKELLDDEKCDIEDKSEVDYELALNFWGNDDFINAMECINNASRINPKRLQYNMVRGDIYIDMGKYDLAYEQYLSAKEEYENSPAYHYNIGLCLENLDRGDEAIKCYEKTLEYAKTYGDACEKLSDYYWSVYSKNCKKTFYDKALNLCNIQLEEVDHPYYRINRGLMYMNVLNLEPAMEDFGMVTRDYPNDWAAWNNLGCCYKFMGEIERAMECFSRAMECVNNESYLPYHNMANCYQILEDYENAIKFYKKEIELFPKRVWIWEEIGSVYEYMEKYDEAKKAYELYPEDSEYVTNILAMEYLGNNIITKKLLNGKAGIRKFIEKKIGFQSANAPVALAGMAKFCWLYLGKLDLSIEFYLEAVESTEDMADKSEYLRELAEVSMLSGKYSLAKEYAEKSLELFNLSSEATINDYISYPSKRPVRLTKIGLLYLCMGNTKKAYEYFKEIENCYTCSGCQNKKCFEESIYLGYYYLYQGDKIKAYEYFKEALERNRHSNKAKFAMQILG